MKVSLMILTVACSASVAFGQGQLTFSSNPTAQIRYDDGTIPNPGSLMVGLYLSSDTSAPADTFMLIDSSRTPLGPSGVFLGGIKSIAGIPGNTQVAVEARAWSAGYNSYEEAYATMDPTVYVGRSGVLPNLVTLVNPGNPPNNFTTAGGFSGMTVSPVPEPSTIAFGALGGLGLLYMLRRRKQ